MSLTQEALEDCDAAAWSSPQSIYAMLPVRAECKYKLGNYKVSLVLLIYMCAYQTLALAAENQLAKILMIIVCRAQKRMLKRC